MDYLIDHLIDHPGSGGITDVLAVTVHVDRQQMIRFATDHGIDINTLPLPTCITIVDGNVTFEVADLDDKGQMQFDDDHVKTKTVTVPQCAPWPLEADHG